MAFIVFGCPLKYNIHFPFSRIVLSGFEVILFGSFLFGRERKKPKWTICNFSDSRFWSRAKRLQIAFSCGAFEKIKSVCHSIDASSQIKDKQIHRRFKFCSSFSQIYFRKKTGVVLFIRDVPIPKSLPMPIPMPIPMPMPIPLHSFFNFQLSIS